MEQRTGEGGSVGGEEAVVDAVVERERVRDGTHQWGQHIVGGIQGALTAADGVHGSASSC